MLTQHILQQALIKKKLEEQKENYRRKQETAKQVRGNAYFSWNKFEINGPKFTVSVFGAKMDQQFCNLILREKK